MWKIKSFDDYHEIGCYIKHSKIKIKGIELGCFPEKGNNGICRYFAVFYTGQKRNLLKNKDKIITSVARKIMLNQTFNPSGLHEFCYIRDDLVYEITQALKTNCI